MGTMNYAYNYACLSMLSFTAIGVNHKNKVKIDKDREALFRKGHKYHLLHSISCILCRFGFACLFFDFAYFYTFTNCNYRFFRWNFDPCIPTLLHGKRR